ncbi:hypothetical protein RF11_07523 [Thelohanellus kitauei]|uniref:Uncharacterized protein n=1 Tax=Thelohanellus kitauei TaxID=669202 RepID=A0A0C2MJ08_THEKT|nr:hypothetical protein RF11_07523 [Thelohanellus kitauei]
MKLSTRFYASDEEAINDYASKIKSPYVHYQLIAIRNLISHFKHPHDVSIDKQFLENFPEKLFNEFQRISNCGPEEVEYENVKTFAFQNKNVEYGNKDISFVKIFLTFIKIKDSRQLFDPYILIESINNCIINEKTKVLFINDNGMLNLYKYLYYTNTNPPPEFLKMCDNVCNIPSEYSSSLMPFKVTETLLTLKIEFMTNKLSTIADMLVTVYRMVYRSEIHDKIYFNITSFYDFTSRVLKSRFNKKFNKLSLNRLCKLWIEIFGSSKNIFPIDTIEKLTSFAHIFIIDMNRKLLTLVREKRKLKFTSQKKLRLCIIYFAFVAFYLMDNISQKRLLKEIQKLRHKIELYFEDKSKPTPIDDILFIEQFFLKSEILLNRETFPQLITGSIRLSMLRLLEYPTLYLDSSSLISHLLLKIQVLFSKAYKTQPVPISDIANLLRNLINDLSDEMYVTRLQNCKYLFRGEDVKSIVSSVINPDFMKDVFTKCESYLLNDFQNQLPEPSVYIDEYIEFSKVLSWIIHSINENKHLDRTEAVYYLSLCQIHSGNVSTDKNKSHDSGSDTDVILVPNISEEITKLYRFSFLNLLNWLALICQMKFVFGDITYKSSCI